MGLFTQILNPCLIRELKHELNTDVVLFGWDGFTYFGNLQQITDDRIAVLTPAVNANSTDVEILTPGGELVFTSFARVDLWQLIAKGTGVVADPIDPPPDPPKPAPAKRAAEEALGEAVDRQESHHLIRILGRMLGDEVAIATLGGFLFQGILSAIQDELAIMTVCDVFIPGTSTSISDTKLRSVVVNLEALTSVLNLTTSYT